MNHAVLVLTHCHTEKPMHVRRPQVHTETKKRRARRTSATATQPLHKTGFCHKVLTKCCAHHTHELPHIARRVLRVLPKSQPY